MATPLGKKLSLLQIGERDVTKMPVLDVEQCAAPPAHVAARRTIPPNCHRPSPPPTAADPRRPDACRWLRLEELGAVRRFSVALKRHPETGLFGLQLTDDNVIVAVLSPWKGNELLQKYDIVIGAEGERLGASKLEEKLPMYGEAGVELEVLRPQEDKRSFVELRRLVNASSSASSASSRGSGKGEGEGEEASPRTAPTRKKWFSRAPSTGRKPLASRENDACDSPELPQKSAPRTKQAEQAGSGVIVGWRREKLDTNF